MGAARALPRRPPRSATPRGRGARGGTPRAPATPHPPRHVSGWALRVGEGFAGPPFHEIAHVDLLIGRRDGPVGRAVARAMEGWGSERGLKVISERPLILLVPTVTLRTARQRQLFYDFAAEGILMAVRQNIENGFLPEAALDDLALIVNAFVHPAASIGRRVMLNNYKATVQALRKAIEGRPMLEQLFEEKASARHPFRYAP